MIVFPFRLYFHHRSPIRLKNLWRGFFFSLGSFITRMGATLFQKIHLKEEETAAASKTARQAYCIIYFTLEEKSQFD